MFELLVIAATVACANGYYNHGPIIHEPYYGNYGHEVPSAPLTTAAAALNPHHGNPIYNRDYGHIGSVQPQTKIVQANYPGAVVKSGDYAVSNPAGYPHGSTNHPGAGSYVHLLPSGIVQHPPPIAYNHGPAATHAHSHYAVTEGPTDYAAHSRYAIAAGPALIHHGHHARHSIAHGGSIYNHGFPVDHGIQKISYTPAIAHMGYRTHADHGYSW